MLLFGGLPALPVAGADPALVLVVALAEDGVVLAARAVEALLHQVRAVRQRTLARKVAATSHKRGVRGDRATITTILVKNIGWEWECVGITLKTLLIGTRYPHLMLRPSRVKWVRHSPFMLHSSSEHWSLLRGPLFTS